MSLAWRWLGGFTVLVEAEGLVVYVDPWHLKEEKVPAADLVLLTNPRIGHTSPEDVALVQRPDTVVAGPADAVAKIPGGGRALAPGDGLSLGGLRVRAVPAANRELDFFPRSAGWLGYVLTGGGGTLYHAGATDRIPEMAEIEADVAFVPVSGRYLMGEEEARAAADDTGAKTRVALFLVGDRYRPYAGFSLAD